MQIICKIHVSENLSYSLACDWVMLVEGWVYVEILRTILRCRMREQFHVRRENPSLGGIHQQQQHIQTQKGQTAIRRTLDFNDIRM